LVEDDETILPADKAAAKVRRRFEADNITNFASGVLGD